VLSLRSRHLLFVQFALCGAVEPRRRLRRADGDVSEGNILLGVVLKIVGPRVHRVHDGHLRRDGLLVHLRYRISHCLHDGLDDVPAWVLLRSRRNCLGRPLLRTLCRWLFLARNHALDAYDNAARRLRGAEHVLLCRNVLLGTSHVHGRPRMQRMCGRLFCVGGELISLFGRNCIGLRIEAEPYLPARLLLQPACDGYGRSRLLLLPGWLFLFSRH